MRKIWREILGIFFFKTLSYIVGGKHVVGNIVHISRCIYLTCTLFSKYTSINFLLVIDEKINAAKPRKEMVEESANKVKWEKLYTYYIHIYRIVCVAFFVDISLREKKKRERTRGGKPRKKKVSRTRLKPAGIYRRYILVPWSQTLKPCDR